MTMTPLEAIVRQAKGIPMTTKPSYFHSERDTLPPAPDERLRAEPVKYWRCIESPDDDMWTDRAVYEACECYASELFETSVSLADVEQFPGAFIPWQPQPGDWVNHGTEQTRLIKEGDTHWSTSSGWHLAKLEFGKSITPVLHKAPQQISGGSPSAAVASKALKADGEDMPHQPSAPPAAVLPAHVGATERWAKAQEERRMALYLADGANWSDPQPGKPESDLIAARQLHDDAVEAQRLSARLKELKLRHLDKQPKSKAKPKPAVRPDWSTGGINCRGW